MNHIYDEESEIAVCNICGLFEGTLTTDCSGDDKSYRKYGDDIYAGKVDYREGEGWVEKLNPTNQSWLYGRIFDYLTQRNDRAPQSKEEIFNKFPSLDEITYHRTKKDIENYLHEKIIKEYQNEM